MKNNLNDSWTEISITVNTADIDTAGNIANMVVPYGIYIEDYSNLEKEVMEIAHIDLIEESLLEADRSHGVIHVYVNPQENPMEAVSFIKDRLDRENISYDINIADCAREDWVNNWKKYFHPTPVGEKLLIQPEWEKQSDIPGRKTLCIEPGLAFGTGSHPTTKLCLETLEKYVSGGESMLDIGCGSGILSIAGLLLGADTALGVDIDSLAVKTANENAVKNGFDESRFKAVLGDLSNGVSGTYDIIVANIVADVIMEFNKSVGNFLKDNGVYITGGIINSREPEVLDSFSKYGFKVTERREEKGWLVFVLKKAAGRIA